MKRDDEVCLCFHVTLGKVCAYLRREDPPVASLISECLGAGTGCGWCVPQLKMLHARHQRGEPLELGQSPAEYAREREAYRRRKREEQGGEAGCDGEQS
jgi:NAD(P)H-nitrite reductase large subunit